MREALDAVNENVVQPVGRALNEANRERMRTTVSGSQPLDGVLGFGVDEHRVWFMDGGRGVYSPEGQLVRVENGDPPQSIDSTQLFLRGIGGSNPLLPGAANGVSAAPPLRLAPR